MYWKVEKGRSAGQGHRECEACNGWVLPTCCCIPSPTSAPAKWRTTGGIPSYPSALLHSAPLQMCLVSRGLISGLENSALTLHRPWDGEWQSDWHLCGLQWVFQQVVGDSVGPVLSEKVCPHPSALVSWEAAGKEQPWAPQHQAHYTCLWQQLYKTPEESGPTLCCLLIKTSFFYRKIFEERMAKFLAICHVLRNPFHIKPSWILCQKSDEEQTGPISPLWALPWLEAAAKGR